MPTVKWSPKDPGDTRDYRINYTPFLAPGQTITNSVLVMPDGLVLVADEIGDTEFQQVNADGSVTVMAAECYITLRVSGGVVGEEYEIDSTATITDGQIFNLTAILLVKERVVKGEGIR